MRLLLAALLLLSSSSAFGYSLKKDGDAPVRFEARTITFRMPAELPDGLDAAAVKTAIERSLATWAEVSGLSLQLVVDSGERVRGYDKKAANHNDIFFVEHGWQYDSHLLGAAVLAVDHDKHAIVDADVFINLDRFTIKPLADGSTPGGVAYDLQTVLTHELGHALGLEHSQVEQAAMYAASKPGDVSRRVLDADDIDGVREAYAPPPSAASAASGAETPVVEGEIPSVGCSAAPGASCIALAPLLVGLLLRRRARRS